MFENGSFLRRRKRFKIPKQEKEALNAVLTKVTTTLQPTNNWCNTSSSSKRHQPDMVSGYYSSAKHYHSPTNSFNHFDETIPFAVPSVPPSSTNQQQNQIASAVVVGGDYWSSSRKGVVDVVVVDAKCEQVVKKRTNFNIESILAENDRDLWTRSIHRLKDDKMYFFKIFKIIAFCIHFAFVRDVFRGFFAA